MTIFILHRPAEIADGGWQQIRSVDTAEDALDELASWQGIHPTHGDLVRLVDPEGEKLFVFDGDKGAFVHTENSFKTSAWEAWEGVGARADYMLRECKDVDRRRLVLAACDCAETALRFVADGENKPRKTIEVARSWVRGETATKELLLSAYEAYDQPVQAMSTAARFAFYDAAEAVYVCASPAPHQGAAEAIEDASSCFSFAGEVSERSEASRGMAKLVRRHIPLSVVACSIVRARDPLPIRTSNEAKDSQ